MSRPEDNDLRGLVWPYTRLGDALTTLAIHSGLTTAGHSTNNPVYADIDTDRLRLDRWMKAAGRELNVTVDHVIVSHKDAADFLAMSPPMLVAHPDGVIVIVANRRGRLAVIDPDGGRASVSVATLRRTLMRSNESSSYEMVDELLADANIPEKRRHRVADTLVGEMLSRTWSLRAWRLRISAQATFARRLWSAGVQYPLMLLVLAHIAQYVIFILSWWTIGAGILEGRVNAGWLYAWALLLLTLVPLHMLTTWYQGQLSVRVGAIIRQNLLHGAMRLSADEVRQKGAGTLFGCALESLVLEQSSLRGGMMSLLALIEFILAALVLSQGAAGLGHVLALIAWLVLVGWLTVRWARRARTWTDRRLQLTDITFEHMVGHSTRLVQSHPTTRHEREDKALSAYMQESVEVDRSRALVLAGVPRGWLILGIAVMTPAFITGVSTGLLATAVGGVLLAWQSFRRLTMGLGQLVGAYVAWQRVAPFMRAAQAPLVASSPNLVTAVNRSKDQPTLEAWGVTFRYDGREQPILKDLDLTVHPGDLILLEGASGGGKSTLASVLVGHRQPSSGLVLARGLDMPSLGHDGWLRRIGSAPQFHENHILRGSFVFNLLLGRNWPPRQHDAVFARSICIELGFDKLLARMPAGWRQGVGEVGWQLSHGECSRVYIARALLQESDVVILDESFVALDPENLLQVMQCVRTHAKALIIIAHP